MTCAVALAVPMISTIPRSAEFRVRRTVGFPRQCRACTPNRGDDAMTDWTKLAGDLERLLKLLPRFRHEALREPRRDGGDPAHPPPAIDPYAGPGRRPSLAARLDDRHHRREPRRRAMPRRRRARQRQG